MNESTKFLFDTSFDDNVPSPGAEPEPAVTADDIEAARLEGFQDGEQMGRNAAMAEIDAAAAGALQSVAEQLAGGVGHLQAMIAEQERYSVEIGVLVARRLAERLIDQHPLAEIQGLVLNCLQELRQEPRLVLRTSERVADHLRQSIDDLARNCGFEGRVVLLPQDDLADQDCRVEWADGAAERNAGQTEQEINDAVARFMNLRTNAAAAQTE